MFLNELAPAPGAHQFSRRVGRGIGSGRGKTCGRGTKGQKSRAGGYHKVGFSGGQMPLQRQVPKFGFNSRRARLTQQIRLGTLADLGVLEIDLMLLKEMGLVPDRVKRVKVIADREIDQPLQLERLFVTSSVRQQIEKLGGRVTEEPVSVYHRILPKRVRKSNASSS